MIQKEKAAASIFTNAYNCHLYNIIWKLLSTILSNFHETKHLIEIAKENGIPVWIYKY